MCSAAVINALHSAAIDGHAAIGFCIIVEFIDGNNSITIIKSINRTTINTLVLPIGSSDSAVNRNYILKNCERHAISADRSLGL